MTEPTDLTAHHEQRVPEPDGEPAIVMPMDSDQIIFRDQAALDEYVAGRLADSRTAVSETAVEAARDAIKELRRVPCRHDYEGVPVSFLGKRMSCDECVAAAALTAALPHMGDGRGELDEAWEAAKQGRADLEASMHELADLIEHDPRFAGGMGKTWYADMIRARLTPRLSPTGDDR